MSKAIPKHVITELYEILLYKNRRNVMLRYFVRITLRLINMISLVNFKRKCISHGSLQVGSGQNHEITLYEITWFYTWRLRTYKLTLILLTWRIWWAPNNASKWQMGFNWVFKGLNWYNSTTYNLKLLLMLKLVIGVNENFVMFQPALLLFCSWFLWP